MTHQQQIADPLRKFSGMEPRYVRERRAAARENALMLATAPPPAPPAPELHELLHNMRAVDAMTSDMRRRLATAGHGPVAFRLPTFSAAYAGAALGVALLATALVTVIS